MRNQSFFGHLNKKIWWVVVIVIFVALGAGYFISIDQHLVAFAFAAVFLLVVIFGKPLLLLKIVAVMAPIYWLPGIPPTSYQLMRDILFLMYFASVVVHLVMGNLDLKQLPPKSGLILLGIVLVSMLPGVFYSPAPSVSLVHWLKSLQVVFFYFSLLLLLKTRDEVWSLLLCFLFGHLFSVGMLWIETIAAQFGFTPPWDIPYPYLVRGEIGLQFRRTAFSGTTAHLLPIVLGIIAGLKIERKGRFQKFQRQIGFGVLTLFVGSILISHGRAGLIAALVIISAALWLYSRKLFFVFFAGVVSVVIMFPSWVMQPFINKGATTWLFSTSGLQQFDRWTGYRLSNYVLAFFSMINNPLGVGLGQYRETIEALIGQSTVLPLNLEFDVSSSAHNLYLDIGSEAGIVAGIMLLFFTFWILRRIWKTYKTTSGSILALVVAGVIIAQLVTAFFEVEIFSTIYRAFPFWISLAAIVKFYSRETPISSKV